VESNPHDNHDIIDLFLDYAAKNTKQKSNQNKLTAPSTEINNVIAKKTEESKKCN